MNLPLTISLLASNRIATLERCLDSLRPLLRQVPAELIVVFTGTDERVRQVAERYTNQIIPFTWCNDFSAARNAGLKHAKGEWFLYLDDDEWFDDVTEICEFFQSGEHQKYNSAAYIQRNYLDWEGSRQSDAIVYRMVKRTPQQSFENPIHEELQPYFSPCKIFRAYVHHYGYINNTIRTGTDKTSRNIPLLQEDIKERPDYTKNYLQLTQEYCIEESWDKAEEICRKGLEICKKSEAALRGWLQANLIEILYKKGQFEEAENEALRILEKEKPSELTRLLLFQLLIGIYEQQKNYEKQLHWGIKFEELLAYMERHPDLWIKQQMGTVNKDKVLNPDWLYPARLNCIRAALELQNYKEAEFFLELFPWEEECRIQTYYPLLDRWKEHYAPHLQELLAKLTYDSSYLLYQKLLYEEQKKEDEDETERFLFHRCLKEIDQPYLQRQLIEKALQRKKNLSQLLERIDLDTWRNHISGIVNATSYEESQYLWEARETLFAEHRLQGLWLEKLLLEKELSRGFLMKESLLEALKRYANSITAYYETLYQPTMLCPEQRHLLPAECRLAYVILEALACWKQGRLPETVRFLRTAIQIDPRMTGVIREVIRILGVEIAWPTPNAGPEFYQLAVQMKEALRAMIDGGRYQEAMSVLPQLLPLLPDDMELMKMQQVLLAHLAD